AYTCHDDTPIRGMMAPLGKPKINRKALKIKPTCAGVSRAAASRCPGGGRTARPLSSCRSVGGRAEGLRERELQRGVATRGGDDEPAALVQGGPVPAERLELERVSALLGRLRRVELVDGDPRLRVLDLVHLPGHVEDVGEGGAGRAEDVATRAEVLDEVAGGVDARGDGGGAGGGAGGEQPEDTEEQGQEGGAHGEEG